MIYQPIYDTTLLPYGRYIVQETKTRESYVLDETQHILNITTNGETYELGLINVKIKGQIKVIKTDGKTKVPLEGVVFELSDADGNVISELTSDENGFAVTDELLYGKYTVVEKSTLIEYVLDDTPQEVFIKDHQRVVELEMQNVKKSGKIKVFKTGGKTNTPLDDVMFEVFDQNGRVVETIVTDKDGIPAD